MIVRQGGRRMSLRQGVVQCEFDNFTSFLLRHPLRNQLISNFLFGCLHLVAAKLWCKRPWLPVKQFAP